MGMKATELAERISAAGTVLSNLYLAAPTEELRDSLFAEDMLEVWPLQDPDSQYAVRHLLAASPDSIEALKRDHLYLYVGIGRALAQPYESPYLSDEGLVFDKQTFEVREAYAQFGFRAPNFNRDPDDHIGLEIAFISNLAKRYAEQAESDPEAAQQTLGAMRKFFFEHLTMFAYDVIEATRKNAKTATYQALADFTKGFINAVTSLVEDPSAKRK